MNDERMLARFYIHQRVGPSFVKAATCTKENFKWLYYQLKARKASQANHLMIGDVVMIDELGYWILMTPDQFHDMFEPGTEEVTYED